MNKISHIISYVIAVCLFCALYVFVFDLACVGRISKFNHIWINLCPFDIDGGHVVCMAHHDIAYIVILLPIIIGMMVYLFRIYRKSVLLIPFLGFVLFILSIVTFWGLI